MQRWWSSGDAARDALGRVDDSDLVMGVGTALLGYHGLAKEALDPLASETLVDPDLITAYLEDIDITPVAKAISAAVASALPAPAADHYGRLLAQDTHRRALAAAPRLATALVAKGASWPTAVARSANVVGVPLERLGTYPGAITKPGLNALGADDVADRVLMGWVSAISKAIPLSEVSKAERERVRGREQEKEAFDEATVNRDELGRFAEEASHAQRLARQARQRRKKKRRARQAAAAASAKEKAAAPKEKAAQGKAREVSQKARESDQKARTNTMRARINGMQARAMLAEAKANEKSQLMELAEAENAQKTRKEHKGAFDLPMRGTTWAFWEHDDLGTMWGARYTQEEVDPRADDPAQVYNSEDLLTLMGGPDAFHGEETFRWQNEALRDHLKMEHNEYSWAEVFAAADKLPPITKETYDPNVHERLVTLSVEDLEGLEPFIRHEGGALPVRKVPGQPKISNDLRFQSATLSELPDGSSWGTTVKDKVQLGRLNAVWHEQDGRMHTINFQVPYQQQYHTANGVKKADRERERTNAPERPFQESEVNRDALGRFAEESSDAERQRTAARLARKKRRTKRRARQAAFAAAREAERPKADQKARTISDRARAFGQRARTGRVAARERIADQRAREPSQRARVVNSDEMPIGLHMFSRKNAPDTGPYTLDEPLFLLRDVDQELPTPVMTEEQMTQLLRGKMTGGVSRRIGQRGQEAWGPNREHRHAPQVFRYEAGTLPLGGKNHLGQYFTATSDQINQTWEMKPITNEAPSSMEFMVSAPGEKYDRRLNDRIEVPVTQMMTHFAKADVSKRERERVNAPERKFNESEVNRDALGRFAEEATDEEKAARTRRLQRKARRNKRRQRTAAWEARSQSKESGQQTRVADQRARQASQKARSAERKARVADAVARMRPSRGREISQAARAVLPKPIPDQVDWANALIAPHETELGMFIGDAGYKPHLSRLDFQTLAKLDPSSANTLYEGGPIALADVWQELAMYSSEQPIMDLRTLMRPILSGLAPETKARDDIFAVSVQLLSEAMTTWTPVVGVDRVVVGDVDGSLRTPSKKRALSLTDDGQIVSDRPVLRQADPPMPVVVGSNAAKTLRQVDALFSFANGSPTAEQEALAAQGWQKVHMRRGLMTDEESPMDLALPEELQDTAIQLLKDMEINIHAMPDEALVETAQLAMSKQEASDIRLDNRGVFLITSRLDKTNGWDRLAEKEPR